MASIRSTKAPPSYSNNNPNLLFPADKPKTLFPLGTTLELPRDKKPSSRRRSGGGGGSRISETESNASTISRINNNNNVGMNKREQEELIIQERKEASTNSPLRTFINWLMNSGQINSKTYIYLIIFVVVYFKFLISLGGYSGLGTPPMRGDFEAQRHWLSLTSSSLTSSLLQPVPRSILISQWYSYDLSYWGLDYPPLTAYHSLFLGTLARFSSKTAQFVTLRPLTTSPIEVLEAWDLRMAEAEVEGGMKAFMRLTGVGSDALIWISAVVVFCKFNYGKGTTGEKKLQTVTVAAFSILLQPALLLIDSGHFQYNSVMLGLTLWSVNMFQASHDLLGASFFVAALCFKQMSLYYSPAIFAYLLGKCFYLGGRAGFSHLLNIGFITALSFILMFLPFLSPISSLFQALHRIFPFARGLFEDKVANFWCVINLVFKLKEWGSVSLLAKAALGLTVLAILPSTVGVIWVSREIGLRQRVTLELTSSSKERLENEEEKLEGPAPTIVLLPHALFISSMAFFLFSFQVHEKSILLPLMPVTILMGNRELDIGRYDWEWAVLLNNVGVFSMWPLLKKDNLGIQYLFLTLFWNFLIGYNPLKLQRSFVKYLSLLSYATILVLHTLELVASPPAHLPDLFPVLNLVLSAGIFGLGFLWASKRSLQESWAVVGMIGLMEPARRRSSGGGGGGARSSSGRSLRGDTGRESKSGRSENGGGNGYQKESSRSSKRDAPSISSRVSAGGQQQRHSSSRHNSQIPPLPPVPILPYPLPTPQIDQFSPSQPQSHYPSSTSTKPRKASSTTGGISHQSLSQSQSQSRAFPPSSYQPPAESQPMKIRTSSGNSAYGDNGLGLGAPRSRQRVESVSVMGKSTNGRRVREGSVNGAGL